MCTRRFSDPEEVASRKLTLHTKSVMPGTHGQSTVRTPLEYRADTVATANLVATAR